MNKNKKNYRKVAALILSQEFAKETKYLIVKKPRKTHTWQFPQGGIEPGETSSEAAKRELQEECGKDLRIKLLFNYSVGNYEYFFPPTFLSKKHGYNGAFVEFFVAKFVSGEIDLDQKEVIDCKWVSKDLLGNYFEQEYLQVVEKFI